MRAKKLFAVLMCTAMVLSLLCACTEETEDQSSAASSEEAKVGQIFIDHLGERNLDGFELVILATTEKFEFGDEQFVPSELNSEPVNDAVYERNSIIEELYNCKLTVEYTDPYDPFVDRVTNDCLSGTISYDVLASGIATNGLASIAGNGFLYDLISLEGSNLQLDQEWWDQYAIEQLSIDNRLYFVSGDILLTDDERTCMLFFNKDLVADNLLEDPYQLVRDGKWTLDKLHEMAIAVAKEGGDGTMDVVSGNDTWGLIGACYDSYKLILGCGATMVNKDENDLPVIAVTDQYNIDAFNKVFDLMTDKTRVAYLEQYYAWNDGDGGDLFYGQFYEGRALFYASLIGSLNSAKMQDSSVQYGVLPMPKYNEEQENYCCPVDPYAFTCIAIPRDPGIDIDKVTFLLEAMGYYNSTEVIPLYYETTLKSKRLLDEESEEMLDIIFSDRIVDLANVFSWDECIQYYNRLVFGNNNGVVSYMESRREIMQSEMDATIELFREID